ncbi:MAG: N-acyl-D-amino-acid deacylase family protein, partial [Rhodospirillales bacterium]
MPAADLIIRNATLVDGTGGPAQPGDLSVYGDRILEVGRVAGAAAREIDAEGLVLAPGFIDAHTHDDNALLVAPDMIPKISQGVTTVIVGNCGVSLAPLVTRDPPAPLSLIDSGGSYRFPRMRAYLDAVDAAKPALNCAALVGHMALRIRTMDRLDRAATADEIATMARLVEESLNDGAIGLSTGLFYPPSQAATTEEVIGVAAPLADLGGIYVTHMRDEADGVLASLEETFRIGRETGAPVVVSHHKVVGARNAGRSTETLAALRRAATTQMVGLDAYPYAASSTMLRREMVPLSRTVRIAWSKSHPDLAGLELPEAAARLGLPVDAAIDALQPAGAIYFSMDEDDVRRILAHPDTMIGSDGLPHDVHPHPRLWGTFPRVLGRYARDEGLFPLTEAVHRMTGLTAGRFGLRDRGTLAPGRYADLVLFDPATVIDRATFDDPATPAAGIRLVVCNGRAVWKDGAPTGTRPGRVIRGREGCGRSATGAPAASGHVLARPAPDAAPEIALGEEPIGAVGLLVAGVAILGPRRPQGEHRLPVGEHDVQLVPRAADRVDRRHRVPDRADHRSKPALQEAEAVDDDARRFLQKHHDPVRGVAHAWRAPLLLGVQHRDPDVLDQVEAMAECFDVGVLGRDHLEPADRLAGGDAVPDLLHHQVRDALQGIPDRLVAPRTGGRLPYFDVQDVEQ